MRHFYKSKFLKTSSKKFFHIITRKIKKTKAQKMLSMMSFEAQWFTKCVYVGVSLCAFVHVIKKLSKTK